MKTLYFTLIAILFSCSFLHSQVTKNDISKINKEVGKTNENVDITVRNLFNRVEEAIKTSNEISNYLDEKQKKGEDLSYEERLGLANKLRNIHQTYFQISNERERYDRILSDYKGKFFIQNKRAESLIKEEQQLVEEKQKQLDQLTSKPNKTKIDEDDIESLKNNIALINATLLYIERFLADMKNVQSNYIDIENNVARFLNQMKNAAETTTHLINYLEISSELQAVAENLDKITKLNELVLEVTKSLTRLAESIDKLEKTASGIQ